MIYGTTANLTFVALDDLGSLGPLFDACRKNDYFGLAELYPSPPTTISAGDQLGFKPPTPATPAGVMLAAGTVLADTWLLEVPTPVHGDSAEAKLFARMFAALIIAIQPKQVKTFSSSDWDYVVRKSTEDLVSTPGAVTLLTGNKTHLRAYINDPRGTTFGSDRAGYSAELVTQLETLEPLLRWEHARNETTELSKVLVKALTADLFFHPEIGTVVDRPDRTRLTFNATTAALCHSLAGKSVDELRYCADSWYIYYPYVKLADIAVFASANAFHRIPWARVAFNRSLDFGIAFARSQNYSFPVLSDYWPPFVPPPCGGVPGCGFENDVAYSFAYTMLRAWQLGGRQNDTLLQEAKAAFSQMHRGGDARQLELGVPWQRLRGSQRSDRHGGTGDALEDKWRPARVLGWGVPDLPRLASLPHDISDAVGTRQRVHANVPRGRRDARRVPCAF